MLFGLKFLGLGGIATTAVQGFRVDSFLVEGELLFKLFALLGPLIQLPFRLEHVAPALLVQLLHLILMLDLLLVDPLGQDLLLKFRERQLLLHLVLLRHLEGNTVLVLFDLLLQLRVLNNKLGEFLPQFLIGPLYLDLLLHFVRFLFIELLYRRAELANLLPLLKLLGAVSLSLILEPAQPLSFRLLQGPGRSFRIPLESVFEW